MAIPQRLEIIFSASAAEDFAADDVQRVLRAAVDGMQQQQQQQQHRLNVLKSNIPA